MQQQRSKRIKTSREERKRSREEKQVRSRASWERSGATRGDSLRFWGSLGKGRWSARLDFTYSPTSSFGGFGALEAAKVL